MNKLLIVVFRLWILTAIAVLILTGVMIANGTIVLAESNPAAQTYDCQSTEPCGVIHLPAVFLEARSTDG